MSPRRVRSGPVFLTAVGITAACVGPGPTITPADALNPNTIGEECGDRHCDDEERETCVADCGMPKPPCDVAFPDLSGLSLTLAADASSQTLSFDAMRDDCLLDAEAGAPWLAATLQQGDQLTVDVDANAFPVARFGRVRFGNRAVVFGQAETNRHALFSDVPLDHVFATYIHAMAHYEVESGAGGRFAPDGPVTAAVLARLVTRALIGVDAGAVGGPPTFIDVGTTHPEFGYVQRLHALQIPAGCWDGSTDAAAAFCPERLVTRRDAAVTLAAAMARSRRWQFASELEELAVAAFADVGADEPGFREVQLMAQRGVTLGCGLGSYCPDDNVTRGQLAVFLARSLLD